MPAHTYATCSKPSSTDSSLRSCTRCKTTSYCSTACQTTAWPSHKDHCKRQNCLLHFHLCPEWISDPPVTRTLSVPAATTFETLHQALQIAFDWAHSHAHDFVVHDPAYDASADSLVDYIQSIARFDRGEQAANPREFLLRIVQDEKRPEEWEELMRKGNRVGYIDRMHEGMRRHPRTVEKYEHKYKVFQLLEDAAYRGKGQSIGDGTLKGGFVLLLVYICIDTLRSFKAKLWSTCTISATGGRTG